MDSKSIGKHLKYKLRELELIIGNIEKDVTPARIDIDLALSKTRELYELLLNTGQAPSTVTGRTSTSEMPEKPVVPSDPEPVNSDEEFEQEGIVPGPVHKQPETEDRDTSKDSKPEKTGSVSGKDGADDAAGSSEEENAGLSGDTGQSGDTDAKNDPYGHENDQLPSADEKNTEKPQSGSTEKNDAKLKNSGKQNGHKEIVADRFQDAQNYINKAMADKKGGRDLTSKIQTRPITDLRNSIGLNEKFLFIKELFRGRPDQYNQCIDMLNKTTTYEEAIKFLNDSYDWEEDNEVAEKLINLVKRKHPAG